MKNQSLRLRERHVVNVVSWTSWNINVGRTVFWKKINHFVTWTSCLERHVVNVLPWTSWNIKKNQSLPLRERQVVNVVSWTSWNIHVGRAVFSLKKKINHFVTWTSCLERHIVNVLKYFLKINRFLYENVMSWTSCCGRLETFTLVELCFEKINYFVTWKSIRVRHIVNVLPWTSWNI